MPRTEQVIMNGWEFSSGGQRDGVYRPIRIPHDWVIGAPFNKDMQQGAAQGYRDRWNCGIGWYRRTLTLAEKREGYKYFLDFGGVYENSTVWVNAKEAGGRKYGYSPFRLDISQLIQQGDNLIEVKADVSASPADRWYSGAGIYRTVKLIEVEERHFNEFEITVQSKITDSGAFVSVKTGINGKIKAVVSDNTVSYEVVGENGSTEIRIDSPKLWSADEPNLYNLTLLLLDGERIADVISMRIGIRDVQFIPSKGMCVNGKKVILKGVCVHQDVGCRGIAAKREIWRERLVHLKEAGCNCIRPSHHIFSSEFLDLCDEMGFYVYEEPFDKWTSGSYARYFQDNWQKDVDVMVKRDRNRPCIVIWGTGNEVENQAQDSMIEILKMIKERILALDDTRPVSYAMIPHFKIESGIDASKVDDIQEYIHAEDRYSIAVLEQKLKQIKKIADIVDIISCNYQEQWYEDIHRFCPDKLILGTEVFQFFKAHRDEIQNYINENPSLEPFKKDYVIGSIIWTGYDYLGESMGYPSKGWSGSLLRTNSEKRFSYYIMQSYWSDKPMVRFGVMDYSLEDEFVKEHWDIPIMAEHWHFPQFRKAVIPYMIASNCDEVALYVNGKRFRIPKPAECPNRIITGFVPYLPGQVKVVGYRNGKEVCSHTVTTPSSAVKLEFDEPQKRVTAEEGYELLLTVRVKDEDGNPYFRESSLVRFRVEGNAEIYAVDNGCLNSSEPYNESFIHMYRGCASVLIRLNGNPGRVAVFADSEGLFSGTAALIAE